MSVAVFLLGVSVGAIVENRRKTLLDRIDSLEKTTQEILAPLGNKVEHVDMRQWVKPSPTWVDYMYEDPEITTELPKVEKDKRGHNVESEEAW
jgi:hypothetical protein